MLLISTLLPFLFGTLALAGPINGTNGCSKPFEFPAEIGGASKGIQIGERKARITLPKNYKHGEPAPLILVFHDKNMTASEMEQTTQLSDSKLNPSSIVVYPEALEVGAIPVLFHTLR
jgi:poly(3-hydroxybutyrate) depolymerase